MKLLLYDEYPRRHGIDVSKLQPLGLDWHVPSTGAAPSLTGYDAVIVHVTDDKKHGYNLAEQALSRNIPVVLYSGENRIASDREAKLKDKNPFCGIRTVLVRDLFSCLHAALEKNDIDLLHWDKLSDVLEVLSSLWSVGLTWEINGKPGEDLLNSDGSIKWQNLENLPTSGERRLGDRLKAIYGRVPSPDKHWRILAVSSLAEYLNNLADLRDSLLHWARHG